MPALPSKIFSPSELLSIFRHSKCKCTFQRIAGMRHVRRTAFKCKLLLLLWSVFIWQPNEAGPQNGDWSGRVCVCGGGTDSWLHPSSAHGGVGRRRGCVKARLLASGSCSEQSRGPLEDRTSKHLMLQTRRVGKKWNRRRSLCLL